MMIARGTIDGVELPFDEGTDGSMTFVHLNLWHNRLILGCAALIPLMAPYELLIRPGNAFQIGMLPFWIISLVALSIAVPLLATAIIGLEQCIVVDPVRRELRLKTTGIGGLRRTRHHPFATITAVEVYENDLSDDGPTFDIHVRVTGERKPLQIWSFGAERRAAHVADLLRARIGLPH